MNNQTLTRIILDDNEIKELAKGFVHTYIRNNNILEDYHAKNLPIDDKRMKKLMIDCTNNVYTSFKNIFGDNPQASEAEIMLLRYDGSHHTLNWDEPKYPKWVYRIVKHHYKQHKKETNNA